MVKKRKARLARYSPLRGAISAKTFRSGRVSVSRDAKSADEFIHIMHSARNFDNNSGFIWGWFAVAYCVDVDTGGEITIAVQPKTDIYFHVDQGDEFLEDRWDAWMKRLEQVSSKDIEFRFMRIIFSAAENQKQAFDLARKERAERQRIGREEAARERRLQAREAAQAKARRTREENKRRAAKGLPKLKKSKK